MDRRKGLSIFMRNIAQSYISIQAKINVNDFAWKNLVDYLSSIWFIKNNAQSWSDFLH